MLNKLSEKQKMYGVIAITLLVLFGAYKFSFSKTFELKQQVEEKRHLLENLDQIKQKISNYENALIANNLDFKTDKRALQNSVLNQVSSFCENHEGKIELSISEFLPLHIFKLEDKTVHTCSFSVKGDFNGLMRLNEELEKNIENGRLSAVEYELIGRERKRELQATYHVQNISEI